jgi:hypothetical protein
MLLTIHHRPYFKLTILLLMVVGIADAFAQQSYVAFKNVSERSHLFQVENRRQSTCQNKILTVIFATIVYLILIKSILW